MIHKMHAFVPSVIEWGKWKEITRPGKLYTNSEIIYPLSEMPAENTQGGKDDEKLF